MKSYTVHYKICDNILENICSDVLHEVDISKHLGEPDNEKIGMLMALEADGYIIWKQKHNFIIQATIKGVQFWRDGGYKEKFITEQDDVSRSNRLRTSTIITMWMAIGIAIISTLTSIQTCKLTSQQKSSQQNSTTKEGESYKIKTSLSEKVGTLSVKQKPIDSTIDAKPK